MKALYSEFQFMGEGCQGAQRQSPWLVDHPETAVIPTEVTVTVVQKCRKSYTMDRSGDRNVCESFGQAAVSAATMREA